MENLSGFTKSLILSLFLISLISRQWNRGRKSPISRNPFIPQPSHALAFGGTLSGKSYYLNSLYGMGMAKKEEYPEAEKRDEPLRAWKASGIKLAVDSPWDLKAVFVSQNGVEFEQVATSIHADIFGQEDHHFELECTCGFYGVENRKHIAHNGWLLEVDLYGTVVVGSVGWARAEKQRVLSVTMPTACQMCEENVSEVIGVNGLQIMAVCRVCMQRQYAIITADLLAALLGCEVKTHSLHSKMSPGTIINVPVNVQGGSGGGSRDLTLPSEFMGAFQKSATWIYDAQIMKNYSLGLRTTLRGDGTENGFFLELSDYQGMRIGEWHFQAHP